MSDVPIEPNDIVISSRIRLARNIADFPFISTCSDDQRLEIESVVQNGMANDEILSELTLLDSFELNALERDANQDGQVYAQYLQLYNAQPRPLERIQQLEREMRGLLEE